MSGEPLPQSELLLHQTLDARVWRSAGGRDGLAHASPDGRAFPDHEAEGESAHSGRFRRGGTGASGRTYRMKYYGLSTRGGFGFG